MKRAVAVVVLVLAVAAISAGIAVGAGGRVHLDRTFDVLGNEREDGPDDD